MVIAILFLIIALVFFSDKVLTAIDRLKESDEERDLRLAKEQADKDKGVIAATIDDALGSSGRVTAGSEADTVGKRLTTNLISNLTLTPLPDDPIFGESGFFANLFGAQQNIDPITIAELDKLASDELGTNTTFERRTRR